MKKPYVIFCVVLVTLAAVSCREKTPPQSEAQSEAQPEEQSEAQYEAQYEALPRAKSNVLHHPSLSNNYYRVRGPVKSIVVKSTSKYAYPPEESHLRGNVSYQEYTYDRNGNNLGRTSRSGDGSLSSKIKYEYEGNVLTREIHYTGGNSILLNEDEDEIDETILTKKAEYDDWPRIREEFVYLYNEKGQWTGCLTPQEDGEPVTGWVNILDEDGNPVIQFCSYEDGEPTRRYFNEFDDRGVLIRRTQSNRDWVGIVDLDDSGNSVYEAYYMKDGALIRTQEASYNFMGLREGHTRYTVATDSRSTEKYEYEYDGYGNWVTLMVYALSRKEETLNQWLPLRLFERVIVYHTDYYTDAESQ